MDFVQPMWAQVGSLIASYAALLPVAVITIYSMTMLVWGSRYRWTLASTLFYVGLSGWAIGGVGAVIDSLIPINFRFHNTVWVVAHFHAYLMMTVVLWALAFVAHLLEREPTAHLAPALRSATIGLLLVGGYGLTGTWFVAGALGVPRRYAVQPAGTVGYSSVGAIFAVLFALGFLACIVQLAPLARVAWARRHSTSSRGETGVLDGSAAAEVLAGGAANRRAGRRVGEDRRSGRPRISASPSRSPSSRSLPSSQASSRHPRRAPATTISITPASSSSGSWSGCSWAPSGPSPVCSATIRPGGSQP